VHLCRGHLDLARAKVEADPVRARELRGSAVARVRGARGAGSYIERSVDVRQALKRLTSVLGEQPREPAVVEAAPEPPAASAEGLAVAASGKWFRAPGAERVNIERRASACLIMQLLAAAAVERTGVTTTVEELFAAGWPGQRALPRSAASRVYVAMSTLRGLGLRDILLRHHDGYLIDPEMPVRLVDDA